MKYKISSGRPTDTENRSAREVRTYDFLDNAGIKYYHIDHDPADNMQDCEMINKTLDLEICKNLFLCNRQKTEFFLLMLPGDKVFKTKDISSQLGIARLSFAGAEFMEKYLDILPGSVSVLGLINDTENHVKLLIDSDLLSSEYTGCHPCVNTSSLKIRTADIVNKFLPRVNHEYTLVNI